MLDNEPNDTTTQNAPPDPAATPEADSGHHAQVDPDLGGSAPSDPAAMADTAAPTDPPVAELPPAKAVRRRRATKAAAAPDPALLDAAPVGADAPDPDGAPQAGATPVKRVRKAAAKKAAPRKRGAAAAAESTASEGGTDMLPGLGSQEVPAPVPEDDVPAAEQAATVAEDQAPAARDEAPTAEMPPAQSANAEDAAEGSTSEVPGEADPVSAGPRTRRRRASAVVTFQAPTAEVEPAEVAEPRRRRRAGTSGALPASALIPALIEPEPVAGSEPDEPDTDHPDTGPDDEDDSDRPRRRRRGRRGRGPRPQDDEQDGDSIPTGVTTDGVVEPAAEAADDSKVVAAPTSDGDAEDDHETLADGTNRRRRRRKRGGSAGEGDGGEAVPTVVHVREPRQPRTRGGSSATSADEDGVRGITGSTRMAAKRVRRQEGRDSGRRRPSILSESEFLARREAVDRTMIVRQQGDRTQMAVLEDGVLVEHYVTKASAQSYAGNVYLGRVQNVLPSMEAAFIDIGKGKNGVLYAGEVNYDAQRAGAPRQIEQVLNSGQNVLVQVSKDPIGHKGARLTSQISLPGRYLVYVPEGSMTGISRKLPETERSRLKAILKTVVPDSAGVIIRTAAEGASEEEIAADVRRLQAQWEVISTKAAESTSRSEPPVLLHAEPDLVIRVVRDVFNEDFTSLVVQGDSEWETIQNYVQFVAPDLAPRLTRHEGPGDVFVEHRIDEQLAKALDRKVWLPSGGSLVIDRTEAMVVIDVNTGKFVGKGGNLEETVTRNNLEAAEEIARQLRIRDLGGIIVVDFIDMVLESNRDLVVRRLVECLGRDRTKHQVAEVTSLGLVQMTRKRVGQGLLESFSEPCAACEGRGVLVSSMPVDHRPDRDVRGPRLPRPLPPGLIPKPAPIPMPAVAAAAEEPSEPEREPVVGRGRRRRGGRGAGTPAAVTATPEGDDPADATKLGDPAPAEAPSPTEDHAGNLPELSDQPPAAAEDLPILPPIIGSVLDPELPADSYQNHVAAATPADAQGDATPGGTDADAMPAGAVVAATSGGDDDMTAESEPAAVEEAALSDGPAVTEPPVARRRRRAISRPAGPPAMTS